MDDRKIPLTALLLGLGGAIPFVACAAALALNITLPLVDDPARALVSYAAVILSFLGGIRWGFALRINDSALRNSALILSVGPAIAAWLLLLPPATMGLVVMPVLFVLIGLADQKLGAIGAPLWFMRLRALLTVVVTLSLLCAIVGLA
ncbi:MAG: DUF3429 domain-containing protein [Beijerinckiaceae bacterium]